MSGLPRTTVSYARFYTTLRQYSIAFFLLCIAGNAYAQPFATWNKSQLTLNNGQVERVIELPGDSAHFVTTLYKPVTGNYRYLKPVNTDFRFTINGREYSGLAHWKLTNITRITDKYQGDGSLVTLQSDDGSFEVSIQFLLYPNLPVVRKKLVFKNLGAQTLHLQSVDVELLTVTDYWATTFSWVCADYGRRRLLPPYKGNMQDALLIVHNADWKEGMVIGNEAPGVLKHTSVFWQEPTLVSGLTHSNDRFPFAKFIAPGETFATPQVFTMVYNNHKDPDEILNTAVPDFVRRHMGTRLSELQQKPTFVYNTWEPFKTNLNEQLIRELAKSAAAAGMKEFVIDDGWEDNLGDWGIDKSKFPNGLKPVFDYIKSLGMKPGLWVSVGSASPQSKVYQQHPEWFVKDMNQQFANLHITEGTQQIRSACFSTGWKDYIKGVLNKLSLEYGLEYLKLDFAVVTSPYQFHNIVSGCYATDHPAHKDHDESMYVNYESVWQLFDELHAAKPNLFIDCTFETMGGLQLIDYAMLQHAEGNWLSNFNGPGEKIDLRIRNMAWWRSPAMPATALVIGNPQMQDTGWQLHLKSVAGALPIMLGDPRKLSATDIKLYRGYADWLQLMENRYGIMSYRQDLSGYDEPKEGNWDGFQRINTDTKTGGIIGVFRHGSVEEKRRVTIYGLASKMVYRVIKMDGIVVTTQTGAMLQAKGFEVGFQKLYDGVLFEVKGL